MVIFHMNGQLGVTFRFKMVTTSSFLKIIGDFLSKLTRTVKTNLLKIFLSVCESPIHIEAREANKKTLFWIGLFIFQSLLCKFPSFLLFSSKSAEIDSFKCCLNGFARLQGTASNLSKI